MPIRSHLFLSNCAQPPHGIWREGILAFVMGLLFLEGAEIVWAALVRRPDKSSIWIPFYTLLIIVLSYGFDCNVWEKTYRHRALAGNWAGGVIGTLCIGSCYSWTDIHGWVIKGSAFAFLFSYPRKRSIIRWDFWWRVTRSDRHANEADLGSGIQGRWSMSA
jgi:hypothetical protein